MFTRRDVVMASVLSAALVRGEGSFAAGEPIFRAFFIPVMKIVALKRVPVTTATISKSTTVLTNFLLRLRSARLRIPVFFIIFIISLRGSKVYLGVSIILLR